ncbi:MAG: C25 family cysteine peptidase [Candidatus Hermodarchaeota archaeon]
MKYFDLWQNLKFMCLILVLLLPFTFIYRNNSPATNPNSNLLKFPNSSSNASNIDLSKLPKIDYSYWYEPKIEMLVITPDNEDFINAVSPLVEWKNNKGLKTIILSNFSEYPGRDNAERIRNMIKVYYERENVKWVLLAGDAKDNLIPIRYVYNPDVVEVGGGESEYLNWDHYYKPTDFYYADLTGSWDNDNDNIFGESAKYNRDGIDEISWTPEVYVGRFPANSAAELEIMVNKSLEYELNPFIGDWMNTMLLAGGISEYFPDEDEARLTEYIWTNYVLSEMNFTHLYKTTSSFNPTPPPPPNNQLELDSNNFDTHFDTGYSTVIFAGHGDPTQYTSLGIMSSVYSNSDASSSANFQMPSLVYADACTTSSYDKNDDSIGEILIKREDAGAIGYIGGLRVTWYVNNDTNLEYLNRGNAKLFWKTFFNQKYFQQGKALFESKIAYMNSDIFLIGFSSMYYEWHRKNILSYCLLGDPELNIYTDKPKEATNPFNESYSEGSLISVIIKDKNNNSIPFASVNLKTLDGKERTVYANENGLVNIRLPPQTNENYNITITGHNLIPSYFNFSTYTDNFKPEIQNIDWFPKIPSLLDNICFNITVFDNHSGVESVFIILSKNDFKDYNYYRIENEDLQDLIRFEYELNKLDPGEYSFAIVARNYANNTEIVYNESFKFTVPEPLMDYILIITLLLLLSLVGVSFFVVIKGIRKRKEILR